MRRAWPFIALALAYFATSPYFAGLNNPNEMVRVYAARAWVEHGTFAIDRIIRDWGDVDDKAKREGGLYSSKAPLQTLVAIPAWIASEAALSTLDLEPSKRRRVQGTRVLASVIPGLAFACVLLVWSRRRGRELDPEHPARGAKLGLGLGLALTLGTMLFPYALTITGHSLAAICVGGAYLAAISLGRRLPEEPGWRLRAMTLGAFAALIPFAEYPAALAGLPIVIGAVVAEPNGRRRLNALGWIGAGGALPFLLGLWAHQQMWGSPFATGYSFLDNPAYRDVHDDGFFGVRLPRLEAAQGALFSAETGLFFFSPVLLVGVAMLLRSAVPRARDDEAGRRHQIMALAGLTGVLAMFAFIASHAGWRGGWTLGPRYIAAVVPILGVWTVEALSISAVRPWACALGAVSILMTGVSGALYPHLSDVFTNPVAHFVIPTYWAGYAPYGLGELIGLSGAYANLVHLVPLLGAAGFVASLSWEHAAGAVLSMAMILAVVPERDPAAARAELQRLWVMWEPAERVRRAPRPGRISTLSAQMRQARVDVDDELACRNTARSCRYGDAPWQELKLWRARVAGELARGLAFHPISGRQVRASFPVPAGAKRLELFIALTDESAKSQNRSPVRVEVTGGERVELDGFGWRQLEVDVAQTSTVSVSTWVRADGERSITLAGDFY